MTLRYILLGLIVSILFSCGTNDISPNRLLIKEIIDPTCYKDVFEYENDRLVGFKRFFGERVGTNTTFHYLDNQLVKVEAKGDQGFEQIIELTYGEDGLRKEEKITTIYQGEVTYVKNGTFSYDNDKLKSIKYTFNDPNFMDPNYLPTETLLEWKNGNLIKMTYYLFDGEYTYLTSTRTMTYDNKRNYANQDIAFIYTLGQGSETSISKNNVTSTTELFGGLTIDRGSYKFTYNQNGYPDSYIYKVESQEFYPIQISYE